MRQTILEVAIHRENETPHFGEGVIHVSSHDMAAGQFYKINVLGSGELHNETSTVYLEKKEILQILDVIDRFLNKSKDDFQKCSRCNALLDYDKDICVNGCHNEDLLVIVLDRLNGFQNSEYRCRENAIAITKIEEALLWLNKRTKDRITRGVEGTYIVYI